MVQTFGKRILGGIGAPSSGAAKAYSEGVNTGINQRMNRQSMSAVDQEMRMREQDQQFKIEDREEAKRRRAAAAANAAATRARNIATTRAIAAAGGGAGGAGPFWPGTGGAGLDVRGAPAARGGNKATALSTGTVVPETPTRTSAAVTRRAKVDAAPTRTSAAPTRTSAAPTRTSAAVTPATDRRTADLNYDNMPISNIVDVQGTRGAAVPNKYGTLSAIELFGNNDLNMVIQGSNSRTLQLYLEALDPSDPNYSWIVADISEELSGRARGFERTGRNGSPTASTATTDVQGTYDNQSTLQQRQAANTRAGVRTGLPIAPLAARPGDFAAQATQRTPATIPLPAYLTEGVAAARRAGLVPPTSVSPRGAGARTVPNPGTLPPVLTSANLPELQQYRKSLTDRIVAETQAVQSNVARAPGEGDDVETLRQMVGEVDAIIKQTGTRAAPGIQSRGITAEEGPGSSAAERRASEDMSAIMAATGPAAARLVNVYGPNGRISVPADEFDPEGRGVPPTLAPERLNIPVPASPELGFGGAASPPEKTYGGTTYGGRLGAAPTPTEMFFSDMGYTPAGQLDIQAIMADQTGPIKDPAFSQIAEQQRVMYMYAAEDAIANGDAAAFIAAQKGVKEQEMLILAQQVVAGADEAINYGSTERLNMAASMIVGVDTVFLPNGDGTADVYVNGQLDDENIPIQSIIDQLRMRVDDAYVKEMSAIAAEDRASQREIYQANEIDRFETMMNMQESEFGAVLARETAREGEFDKITAKVIEQKLIDSGQLPSTSKNTVVKTDNGIVVISEDGGIEREYLFSPEDGRLTEILE